MKPLSSLARWLLALIVLSTAGVAEAGVSPFWQSLGGSATGNGVSQTVAPKAVFEVSTAVGSDGRPVVTYVEYANESASQGSVIVKRWTGAAWQVVSPAGGLGQGYAPQIRIAASGTMNVAWLKDDASGNTEIHLRTATSTTWTALGTSDSAGGIVGGNASITAPFSLALDDTGKPLVAFLGFAQTGIVDVTDTPAILDGSLQVYVKRWTGTSWDWVGPDITGGGASNAVSFTVDPTSFVHFADTPSLAIDSTGAPVVAFVYNTLVDDAPTSNTDVYAVRWFNGAWNALGPAVPAGNSPEGQGGPGGISNSFGGSFNPSLAADVNGRLALAWEEEPPSADIYVWVRVWNGTDSWDELAGSASSSGFNQVGTTNVLPQIAVDTSGPDSRPIVTWEAWTDPQAAPQIFVLRWNGTDAWEEVRLGSASGDGISAATLEAFAPSLALTPSGATAGTPTVAWLDARDPGSAQIFLRQFFVGTTFPLTVNLTGDGSVTSTPIGVECTSGPCVEDFPSGTSVTLSPQGGPGGVFGSWSGACTGTGACTIAMTAARTVSASFVSAHTLTVAVPNPGGRVTSAPAGITACTDSCTAKFAQGATVTLTAAIDPGGSFLGWGGDCAARGTNLTCPVTLGVDRSVTAAFSLKAYRLNVAVITPAGTSGQGGVGRIGGPGLDCGPADDGLCSVDVAHGTHVFLQANPEAGNKFISWTGGPCAAKTTAICDFTMTANASTTALLRGVTTVQIVKDGSGSGTVTGPGISCGADCSEAVFLNTLVTLTPTPSVDSSFAGWAGDVCDGQAAGPCTFTASGLALSVTPTFQLKKQRLAVTVLGNGSAVSAPAGIVCGAGNTDCGVDYDYGTSVVLTPTASTDSLFSAWTGCTSLSGQTCTVAMIANRTLTLKFVAAHTLAVSASGNGAGKISTATAPVLTCLNNCSASQVFPSSATVVLTPAPAVGSNFHWVGGNCTGAGACTLTMAANRTAVGQFSLNRHLLAVASVTGGSVSSPGAFADGFTISCGNGGTDCSDTLDYGTPVTLQATPNTGFVFVNWTGAICASGAANATCAFVLKGNTTVVPHFRARTVVSVVKAGAGSGTVTSTGISCGTDCAEPEFDGKLVTLRATPAVGSHFVGFGGACVSNTSVCAFVPSGDSQNVSATFALNRYTATVVNRLNGSVVSTSTLPDAFTFDCGNTQTDCTDTLDYGTPITLQAAPVPGFAFVSWTGVICAGGATNATCAFVLKANTTVTPNYRARTVVTVIKAGPGSGTVTSTGISCGVDCSEPEFDGKPVILTATPAVGSQFAGFGGACVSSTKTCTFTPTGSSQNVSATFTLIPYTLTVVNRSNGNVALGAADPIDCGNGATDCTSTLDYGTVVTLQAMPNAGSRFVSWTGVTCAGGAANNTCQFTLKANTTVTPTFRDVSTVSLTKSGQGTVVSTPAGINCGVSCSSTSFDFARNTIVKLTPVPAPGKTFTGWSVSGAPACPGTGACSFNASATSVFVTATFTP